MNAAKSSLNVPLAASMRPSDWNDFQGLAAIDRGLVPLFKGEQRGKLPSIILWGPPGCGKTTLANLIARSQHAAFIELSAVTAGVKEVREVVAEARERAEPTILFLDEIHRFNKAQQDALLPHIESGVITLIGATTENPSFYVNGALLSRCRVVVLKPLTDQSLEKVVTRAEVTLSTTIDDEAKKLLIGASQGDARRLLNMIEVVNSSVLSAEMTATQVREVLSEQADLIYDREGDEHYGMASAFIKSLRGSDPDAALLWGFRMIEAGEDPRFVIRRLMIFASEDIGNADPRALQVAVSTAEAYERIGLPEGRIPIAQCITYLATAPKSNRSYAALNKALAVLKSHRRLTVPAHLRNAPTGLMKSLGFGADYAYPHDSPNGYAKGVRYFPEEIKPERYYEPATWGYEKIIGERMEYLRTGLLPTVGLEKAHQEKKNDE